MTQVRAASTAGIDNRDAWTGTVQSPRPYTAVMVMWDM